MTGFSQTNLAVQPSKMVIADDHPLVLSALSTAVLEVWPNLEVVLCLTLKEVAQALCDNEHHIDVILLDLLMPGSNGLNALNNILKAYPTIPVIVISGKTDLDTVNSVMALGASGYLAKNLELHEMTAAISKVLNGELWAFSPPQASPLETPALRNGEADRFASLSEKQRRILQLIVEGKLNKQIAGEVGIAEQTVKIHVSNILKKLGVRTRTQAAVAAQQFIRTVS